jgi:hypothetical protein
MAELAPLFEMKLAWNNELARIVAVAVCGSLSHTLVSFNASISLAILMK